MTKDPASGLEEFLTAIWREHEALVYVPTVAKDGEWKKAFFQWPKHKNQVINYILVQGAQERDVYISPVLWTKPTIERSSILGSWVVWTEFDGNAPDQWPERPNDHATDDPGTAPGHPSIIVQSSQEGHQHCYWALNELCTNIDWLENTNRSITYAHNADSSAWDASQLLRPPFSVNFGKTRKNVPVLLHTLDDTIYLTEAFKNLKPVIQTVSENLDISDLPDPLQVVGKYVWDPDNLALLNKPLEELTGNKEGRSGAMMRLSYYCAELGMQENEMYSILLFLDEKWGKFKGRNDRQKRLLEMVNKAKLKYPGAVAELDFNHLADSKSVDLDPTTVFRFMDFVNADFHVDWVIKDLIAEQTIGIIAGAPRAGKTQVMLGFGMNCALGRSFLGFEIIRPNRVMFLSLEMGRPHLHRFLSNMVRAYTPEQHIQLQENMFVLPVGQQMSLMKAPAGKISLGRVFFEKQIQDFKPDAIYIDSLSRILPGDFTDQNVIELYAYFSVIRAKYNVHIMIVHHNRKAQGDNKRPRNLEDIYGSQFIGGEADYAFTLWREKPTDKIAEFSIVKNRLAEELPPFYIQRQEHLQFTVATKEEIEAFDRLRVSATNTPLGVSDRQNPFG